ncbi:MAG: serine/threonine protein kinase [Myxococcales bacterium]|nr:serine/threonine protein kinase [Myxococcales bacterium]
MVQDSKSQASSERPTTIEPAEDSVELSPSVAPAAEVGSAGEHSLLTNPELAHQHAEPADPRVGTTFAGRYRIISKLGEGGMGVVYIAEHIAIEKKVALKVLLQEYARKADLKERFLQEAKAAARIGHENIVDITDFGDTPDGSVFFAMEFLEGQELSQAVKKNGAYPWQKAKPILLQICRAMGAAHSKHIIHRDMKPENIFLIEREGKPDFVKVLDFGIAKVTDDSPGERRLTKTGMIFGTPEYMSPEQAQGHKPDHRVDIYALGVIMYELLTGRVPFKADTFMGILTKHIFEQPTPPSEVEPSVPGEVEAIILKAMAKDRDDRYRSMAEMASAISTCAGRMTRPTGAAQPAVARKMTPAPSTADRRNLSAEPMVPPPSELDLRGDLPIRPRSKLPFIIVGVLLVAGGVTWAMMRGGGGGGGEGTGSGSATSAGIGSSSGTGSGSATGAGIASGTGVASGSGTAAAAGTGSGSALAAGSGTGSGSAAASPGTGSAATSVRKAAKVRLTIISDPQGARIYIDGDYIGKTTNAVVHVKKSSSPISVVLKRRGYYDLRKSITPSTSRRVGGELRRRRQVVTKTKTKTKTKAKTKVNTGLNPTPSELMDPFRKNK